MSLVNNDGGKIQTRRTSLRKKSVFSKGFIHQENVPNAPIFSEFFGTENTSSEQIASTWEGVMSIDDCKRSSKTLENNKTPDTDGLTSEFYRCFWNLLGSFMVSSFIF